MDVTQLTFSNSVPEISTITTGTNAFKADGDGSYDVKIAFQNSGTVLFDNIDEIFINITGITGLTASDFDFISQPPTGGNGFYLAAVHVQGISGGYSGLIGPSEGFTPIPEPATMFLLGTGLVGVAGVARKKIRKNQA